MQRRLVIVPRWSGRASSDFYPWPREQLAALQGAPFAEVIVPELPDPDAPRIDTWPPAILAPAHAVTPQRARARGPERRADAGAYTPRSGRCMRDLATTMSRPAA